MWCANFKKFCNAFARSAFWHEKPSRACKCRHEWRARARSFVHERSLSLDTLGTRTHTRTWRAKSWLVHSSSKLYRRFFILSVSLPASTGAGRSASFPRRVSRADLVYDRAVTTHARTMKYRVTSQLPTRMMCVVVLTMTGASASPTEPLPSALLGGIGNVANTATNFRESI